MYTRAYSHVLSLVLVALSACTDAADSADSVDFALPLPSECPDSAFWEDAIRADVAFLASPELDGRVPGTSGDERARAVVRARFECLGLTPVAGDTPFEQPFTDAEGRETANVIGYLPGDDVTLGADIVVVSAHLDHLGNGRLGANDNASGVAALLSIAQSLAEGPAPARTVVFAAFGSEESGMEGATAFMDRPPSEFEASDVVYNLNMDMVGTYAATDIVYALGALPGTAGRAAVAARRAEYPELAVGLDEPSDLSDNYAFCSRGVPYLFFWTEDPDCYHETCDTADRLDYASLVEIARLTRQVTADLANSASDLRGAVVSHEDVCGG